MPAVKGRCDRDALLHTLNFGMFKSDENNCATIKNIYNEYANMIGGCYVACDTNDSWNPP